MAALAGSWIALVAGLTGMRDRGGILSFAPRLPEELTRLAFKVSLRGRRLAVDVRAATATYTLLDGEPMRIMHHGQPVTASPDDPVACPIPAAPDASPAPAQPPGRAPGRRVPTKATVNHPADNYPGRYGRLQPPAKGEPQLPGADPRRDLVPQRLIGPPDRSPPPAGRRDRRPPPA